MPLQTTGLPGRRKHCWVTLSSALQHLAELRWQAPGQDAGLGVVQGPATAAGPDYARRSTPCHAYRHQLVLLNAANTRHDGCLLPIPKSVKARGAALDRALTSLLRAGLVAETAAGKDQPVWNPGAESGAVTLTLTDAGRAVLEPDAGPGGTTRHRSARAKKAIAKPDEKASRSATIMRLLSRKSGASIEDLTEATGWQEHSVRGLPSGTSCLQHNSPIFLVVTKHGDTEAA